MKFREKRNQKSQRSLRTFVFLVQMMLELLQITVYAAYLYDAVMLYARALDAVLRDNGSATDGVAIFNKINGTSYQSTQVHNLFTSSLSSNLTLI